MYRVILADDEAAWLGWLRAVLEASCDFLVVGEARCGAETLRLVALLEPDLVITDVQMPDPDGLDVAAWVQRRSPATRVILISGLGERGFERLAREAGALALIPKARLSLEALYQVLQRGG